MAVQVILPIFIAFLITVVISPILIPWLKKLKVGNTEREELKSHQKKTGTPTMGGLAILIAITITALLFAKNYPRVIPVLLVTLGYGAIGFVDDFLKVVLHRSDGFKAWQKMICEIVVTALFAVYLVHSDISLDMRIPFTAGKFLSLGWVAVPILFLAVIGTVNGVNFTDGLDGLATSVTLVVAAFFVVASVVTDAGITPIAAAAIGALLGFLLFNCYPAKVFMGDTGSLALGGFVSAAAYMMQMPIYILLVGLIYWVEILSVMIQVTYFKKTGGKRIFKMAPIHHHFELSGWSETRVVSVFTVITALLCLVSMIGLI